MPENTNTPTPQRTRRQGQRIKKAERTAIQDKFLEAFSMTANVRAACLSAGIDRATVYQWEANDPDFADKFHAAELDANDMIRAELFRRAVQGVEKPVVSMGKVVYQDGKPLMVREYSDSLLSLLAKARMPEFRDTSRHEVTGKDGGPIQTEGLLIDTRNLSAEQLELLKSVAQTMKEREQ
jgi:hypothetical protein